MPDLGEGLEDATITAWSVAVGDDVELNQTLCTVETNKAEVEIPSPYAGRVVELGGAEGETLPVGSVLVRIATDAESPAGEAQTRARRATAPTRRWTHSRRPAIRSRAVPRQAAGPEAGRRTERRPRHIDRIGTRRCRHPRGRARRGGDHVRSAPSPDMVAVRGVQAEMARRMTLSRREIPDAHAAVQVDGTNLLRLRDRLRDRADGDRRLRRSC